VPPALPKLAAAALALLTIGGLGLAARCTSASMARCSLASLTGTAPHLDVPYAVTRPELVERMLDLGRVGAATRLLDLGTGDGRIARAAARRGADALGIDIDPVLIREATGAADREGLSTRARFRTADLFATRLGDRDVVTMFLLPQVNLRLRPRLLAELRPGARVVSHAFTMGDWPPDAETSVGGAHAYLWIVPAPVAGRWRLHDGTILTLTQRYQQLTATVARPGGSPQAIEATLRGDRLRLVADGRVRTGTVSGPAITGPGWSARRIEAATPPPAPGAAPAAARP